VNNDLSEIERDPLEPPARTSAGPESEAVREPRRGGSALGFLALLVALGAAAGTGWLWWQGQLSGETEVERLNSEVARLESNHSRLSAELKGLAKTVESLSATGEADALARLEQSVSGSRAQMDALQQALQEQVALTRSQQQAADVMHTRLVAAEAALAEVSGRARETRGELDLAEVDYLLRLASERLQLFSDPEAADRALVLADSHLAALDNPAFLVVRQDIASARSELGAIHVPDDPAIAGQLDAMQNSIPALPFPETAVPSASTPPGEEAGWWDKLKATLASLVTVRRSTDEENRRISLLDQDYLRQRVWLQLEIAYLALMRRDQAAFDVALNRVQASIDKWFDSASSEVRSFNASLAQLRALEIAVTWPDISAPWNTLRLVRSAQTAPMPVARPPVAAPDGAGPDDEPAPPEDVPEERR